MKLNKAKKIERAQVDEGGEIECASLHPGNTAARFRSKREILREYRARNGRKLKKK